MSFTAFLFRSLRYGLITLLSLIALIAVLIGALGFTARGNQFLADQAAAFLESPDLKLDIDGLSGLLDGSVHIDGLTVADSRGVYATVRDVDLTWRPLDLLKARVQIDALRAGEVAVSRPPVTTVETVDDGASSGLPVEIALDRLALPRIDLGAALIGRDASLSAEGSAKLLANAVAATLNASERARPEARARAVVDYRLDSGALKADIDVVEPAGGLIANLLQLPGRPDVALSLKGDGTLDNWRGAATGMVSGQNVLRIEGGGGRASDGAVTVSVTGGGQFAELLPPEIRPFLTGDTRLDLDASRSVDGAITISKGAIANDRFRIDAQGKLDPKGEADLALTLVPAGDGLALQMPGDDAVSATVRSAKLALSGPYGAAKLSAEIDAAEIKTPQAGLADAKVTARSDSLDLATASGRIEFTGDIGALTMSDATAAKLLNGPARLSGAAVVDAGAITIEKFRLEAAKASVDLAGRFDRTQGSAEADFAIDADLAAVAPPQGSAALAGQTKLAGSVVYSAQAGVALDNLKLDAKALDATGKATLGADQSLTGALDLALSDARLFDPNASGAAKATVTLSGSLNAPKAEIVLSSDQLAYAGQTLAKPAATVSAGLKDGALEATVDLAAEYRGLPLSLTSGVSTADGAVVARNLTASLGKSSAAGDLTLNARGVPEGQIAFKLEDLDQLAGLAGQTAQGALAGTAKLFDNNGKIGLDLQASGDRIAAQGADLASPELTLRSDDLLAQAVTGDVAAKSLTAQGATVVAPKLDLAFAEQKLRFDLAAELDKAPLAATGTVDLSTPSPRVTMDRLEAAPRGVPLKFGAGKTLSLTEGGSVTLDALNIAMGSGAVTVSGSAGAELDLTLDIKDLPLDIANRFVADQAIGGFVSGKVRITGKAADPKADFDLKATALSANALATNGLPPLDADVSGRYAAKVVDATIATTIRNEPVTLKARVDISTPGIKIDGLDIRAAGAKINGGVSLDTANQPTGTFQFDIPDAGKLAALAGRKAEGAYDGSVRIAPIDKGLSVNVTAKGDVREQPLSLSLDLTRQSGLIALPAFDLSLGPNKANGALTLNPDLLPTGKINFDLPDLSLLAAMGGQTAEGALKGQADIRAENGRLAADVTAKGALRGQEIDINLKGAQTAAGGISIPSLNAMIGPNRIEGAIKLDSRYKPEGQVRFTLPDLGLIGALAGQPITGALEGESKFASKGDAIEATVKARSKSLSGFGAEIKGLNADMSSPDLLRGVVTGSVRADRIAQGANAVDALALDFDRQGAATQFALTAKLDGAPAAAKGKLTPEGDGLRLDLQTLSAAPRGVPVKLTAPASLVIAGGAVDLGEIKLALGGGSVTVKGAAGGEKLALDARISALPAQLANSFSPGLGASGAISGTASVAGSPSQPRIGFDLAWKGAETAQTRAAGLGAFAITAKGATKGDALSLDVTANGGGGLNGRVTGSVGLTGAPSLALKAQGKLPFAALGSLTAPQGLALKGAADFQLSISGAATNPNITGRISTSGAEVTVIRQNLVINKIAATIDLDGKQARISRLTGNFASGGSLAVGGTIGIAPGSNYPANLTIDLNRAVYTDGRIVAAKLSGKLTLTGPLVAGPQLGGEIRIARADITVPQSLPGSLGKLNIRHVDPPADVAAQAKAIGSKKASADQGDTGADDAGFKLNLTISAPRQIFVRGRGLDAELGGRVRVAGTAANPRVIGAFNMRRGRLSIVGRRLDFTSGSISFTGGMMPALDLVATSTLSSTTATVSVAGPASDPKVTFSSSPSLPQDEILAQLIFGRSASSLSAVQIAQLADAVASLAGGQSSSLFDKLRQGLGVDDLDLGTDENGNTALSVGKYINKRTYLQFQQGSDSSSTRAIINLDVGKGVKLKGSAGADGSTGAGVFYEKEY
ncbi:translocation/assembly module TamB domain-containing protein [Rhizobium sp. TRM95796]|uniref:translocation/assembly module TamB domain-containing protein n=1 Tax=Rhizobium sp. TRM95796 TaxID=2979862 RepID=UPI0021E8C37F|nr:translocation/assembly module TamB domain-containing protein [Rhizobium sp. TRM95796]MCV3765190.1 translocation/assembly module TamB domain-containing protein [Rhizobium sp. TRM95796]